ncbi:CPBP family intramembrane glutamic endopeptidase [Haladaptatus cibarius]|uniref:CPBP family intramembrane glutamic endopeptidase n=1 Tax=Haladaptatus cibarius TaxID=453847 RepID=UPI0006784A16|nr:CPBP family intramembrane glutamic endopeptidase [Haladaptatus cibarius]
MQTTVSGEKRTKRRSFLKGVVATFLLGVPGIAAVGLSSIETLRQLPELADLPAVTLFFVAISQPLVLLAVACLVGTTLAPRVGLQSRLLARLTGRIQPPSLFAEEAPIGIGVGVAASFLVLALDFAFAPFLPAELSAYTVLNTNSGSIFGVLASIPVRFLYGGITEELLLRYGFMTFVVWGLWTVSGGERPTDRLMWSAILASALVFGLGHLPAMSIDVPLTPIVVVRTVLLNGIAGVGFGWLYWRQSLETAMVGHASFHVVLVIVSLLFVL